MDAGIRHGQESRHDKWSPFVPIERGLNPQQSQQQAEQEKSTFYIKNPT